MHSSTSTNEAKPKGYEPALFQEIEALESAHFWFRQRNRLIIDLVASYFPTTETYLEVGCGTGYVLQGLSCANPNWQTLGAELYKEGLDFARRRLPETALLQIDARCMPFSESIDLIGSFDVLEHIDEDEGVLESMHRALKPGGGLLVSVPQHPWLWSSVDVAAHHFRRYRRGELEAKMKRAGFEVLRSTSFVSALLPAMMASRFLNRVSRTAQNNALRELRIGRFSNAVGFFGAWLDRAVISRGGDLPFGGSRIIAARKIG